MNTMAAFAMGEANRGNKLKVFDWKKAAEIIRDRKPQHASAGLEGDWEWTGGGIYAHGKPIDKDDTYTFLASTWATPELCIDGEYIECWTYNARWNSDTYWPKSALNILNNQPIRNK